jgi:hypothetical protein
MRRMASSTAAATRKKGTMAAREFVLGDHCVAISFHSDD